MENNCSGFWSFIRGGRFLEDYNSIFGGALRMLLREMDTSQTDASETVVVKVRKGM